MTYSFGKWTKQKFLSMSTELQPLLPNTRKLSKQSFLTFLRRYGKVIVKPSSGQGGAGVMQILSVGSDKYEVHYENHRKTIKGMAAVYSFVQGKTSGTYIVQRRISLAKVKGRPFDVRVMVQRKKHSSWHVTGTLAKIAGSGYFITNIVRSQGRAVPLSTAIRESNIRGGSSSRIQSQINHIALKAVNLLQNYYRINAVGLDIGIDSNGKVWIIEANFAPDKTYFLRLKDKSMYRRIMSFYKNR